MTQRANTFEAMWQGQRGRCYYCNTRMSRKPQHRASASFGATFDHIIPLSQGGAKGRTRNTVLACRACNQERGTSDARMFWLYKQGMIDGAVVA